MTDKTGIMFNKNVWKAIIKIYKDSMPLLMFLLALITVGIGWNQYKLSEKQKLYEIKKMYLVRCYDSVKEISNDIAIIAQISRDLLRKSLGSKDRIKTQKQNQKVDLTLNDDIKLSIKDFYKKWDDINTKIASNQHSLPSIISNKYQKFTYSVAFARNERFKDPWNQNYVLEMTELESGKTIKVNTDDRMALPYGRCFNVGQRLNDFKEYNPKFYSKSDFISFLDDCQELGNYTFDIHQDILTDVSNQLVEFSITD